MFAPPIWQDVVFTLNNSAVTPEGYLDVTKAPYNMDNNGGNAGSNTTSLQQAIDDAFAHDLAVFFPEGTYDINNQLELLQEEQHMTTAHVLVGSAAGASRPVIRVTGSNFDSGQKPVFFFYTSDTGGGPPATDRAAAGYNNVFRGIDIDLNGKAGAIGIRMHAAQGSTIQDVSIFATGAFAGVEGLCGSGTTHANVYIEGGQYGFYVSANRPMPVLTGITCIDQTVRAIHFSKNLTGPITIVGFHIEAASGPVFDLNASKDKEHLSLVDGSIEITGGSPAEIIKNHNRSVYMRNVYVKNGNKIVNNIQGVDLVDNSGNWSHVEDYCYFHVNNRKLIDEVYTEGENSVVTLGSASAPPSDLISRHLWDESAFPHHEDGNCIFVGPNDGPDDTVEIQNAIDNANGKAVFLMKGDYYLNDSLVLKADTKLVGVARNMTRLHCDSGWTETSYTPMIKTPANGANATCLLAWLAVHPPLQEDSMVHFIDWTAGRHSMVREVHFKKDGNWNGVRMDVKRIKISGTGGGRWYSLFTRSAAEQGENPDHRQVYITGTSEPLAFYAYTIEYHESEVYMSEINNSENISFYGFKIETDISVENNDTDYKQTPALGIIDSSNIFVAGSGGLGHLDNNEADHGLFEVAGSSDAIELANIAGGWKAGYAGFGLVSDFISDQAILKTNVAGAGDPAALYRRGTVSPYAYVPPSGGGGGGGGNLAGLNTMLADTGNYAQHVANNAEITTGVNTDEWDFEHVSGDEYRIKRSGTNDYMESSSGQWVKIKLQAFSGADNQIWIAHDQGGGVYKFENKQYPSRFLREISDNKVNAPDNSENYSCTEWIITASSPPSGQFAGLNTMQTIGSLNYAKTDGGINQAIPGSPASGNNVWEFEHVSGDDYRIKIEGTTKYINLPASGANCTLVYGAGGDARIWTIIESNTPGKYNLFNKAYPTDCLFSSDPVVRGNNNPSSSTWNNGKWTISAQ